MCIDDVELVDSCAADVDVDTVPAFVLVVVDSTGWLFCMPATVDIRKWVPGDVIMTGVADDSSTSTRLCILFLVFRFVVLFEFKTINLYR